MAKGRDTKVAKKGVTKASLSLFSTLVLNGKDLEIEFSTSIDDGKSTGLNGHLGSVDATVYDFASGALGEAAANNLPSMLHKLPVLELDFDVSVEKGFNVLCATEIEFQNKTATLVLKFAHTHSGNDFGATILLGQKERELSLSVKFEKGETSKRFVGTFSNVSLDVKSIIGLISDELAGAVPDDMTLDIGDLILAYEASDGPSKVLIGANLDLGGMLSLSELPIVGDMLPNGFGVDGAQILASTAAMTKGELEKLGAILLNSEDRPVPSLSLPKVDIAAGAALTAALKMGSETRFLRAPLGGKSKAPEPNEEAPEPDIAKHHSFGPLKITKTSFEFRGQRAWIMLDAAINAAGITLSLKGLGLGIKLSDLKHPKPALEGIGLGYDRGGVRLSGALERQTHKGSATEQFAGAAVVATEAVSLSAIGAYSKEAGKDPSLFLYAVLDQPMGGPAFFFVKGLAAGFGYNRRLTPPTVDDIEHFPLIQAAMKPADDNAVGPQDMLGKLDKYLPAAEGENFIAVGVRFSTFELVETFALLTLGFGKTFDATLLGISTLEVPPECPTTPLARVRIGLVAHVDDGALEIDGKILDGSYVFSKDCRLSGGFAFYSWFTGEHAGDFVMTVGGYHPDFTPPSHYPKANRLALNWVVDPELTVKGSCYFALTSLGMMAGGHLSAVWKSGAFSARFKADADFLVVWEPYHYEADISVSVSASYTFKADLLVKTVSKTISVEIGAGLQLRGPNFSGTAYVDLDIVFFTVDFGKKKPCATRIDWEEFAQKFLPKTGQTCTFTLKGGLIETRKTPGGDVWIVNPKTFHLIAETAVPVTLAKFSSPSSTALFDAQKSDYALPSVRPAATQDMKSELTLNVACDKRSEFSVHPIAKSVPAALWGAPTTQKPAPNDTRLLKNALCGFEIRPAVLDHPMVTAENLLKDLTTNPHPHGQLLEAGAFSSPDVGSGKGKTPPNIDEISADLLAGFSLNTGGQRI